MEDTEVAEVADVGSRRRFLAGLAATAGTRALSSLPGVARAQQKVFVPFSNKSLDTTSSPPSRKP
ncbi:MAG: hypothetical protein VB141_02015 [Burkholderia gladioli]